VLVHLLGGDLSIEVETEAGGAWRVFMTGPAEEVFTCELSGVLMDRLGWPGDSSE
jgi:diaminopimelate epimerase